MKKNSQNAKGKEAITRVSEGCFNRSVSCSENFNKIATDCNLLTSSGV
jgi:hypothetical protein